MTVEIMNILVYHRQSHDIVSLIWAVATGFPCGQTPLASRLEEIKVAVRDGATEIDIVINRTYTLTGNWKGILSSITLLSTCIPYKMVLITLYYYFYSPYHMTSIIIFVHSLLMFVILFSYCDCLTYSQNSPQKPPSLLHPCSSKCVCLYSKTHCRPEKQA